MNNVVFLTYLETARVKFLCQMLDLAHPAELPVILAEVTATYKAPAFFGEVLTIGVGVSRFGVETQAGPWRWVDVVWCWRSQAGTGPDALRVLRTSEPELYAAENGYFSETNPSFWPPSLVVSGFADLDRDKRMEVISSLLRPYGRALLDGGAAAADGEEQTEEIWLRDSAIHAWTPDATPAGQWAEVYRTVTHEARMRELNPGKFQLQRYGKR